MRSPLPALQAFSRDAQETAAASDEASSRLAEWFAVTKAAERLSAMQNHARAPYLSSLALDILPPSSARPTLRHDVQSAPANSVARLAERLRVEAEEMERAGCFEMAFTTVAAACRLSTEADLVSQLTATAHLGRIARQLGDLVSATDCYDVVVSEASRVRDGPLGALGVLGLGNVARNRGNRPEERRLFDVALSLAHPGGTCEISARQGLMLVANSEHRLSDALVHGWRAFDLCDHGSETQTMVLSNLAYCALRGGYAGAALAGFLHILNLTTVPRVRLPALGGAMRAAALRADRPAVAQLSLAGQLEAASANVPFEVASYSLSGGEAWQTLYEWQNARAMLLEASRIASRYGYHELQLRAEATLSAVHLAEIHKSAPAADRSIEASLQQPDFQVPDGIRRLEVLGV